MVAINELLHPFVEPYERLLVGWQYQYIFSDFVAQAFAGIDPVQERIVANAIVK